MGKWLVLVGVALIVGLLVYWLGAGHIGSPKPPPAKKITPQKPTVTPEDGAASKGNSTGGGTDSGPIEPPRTSEEKERDRVESRRGVLYARLHQALGGSVTAVRPADEDPATLDLYAARDEPGTSLAMLNVALKADAGYYGFRHIRFYAPNPPQSIERYRLDAEASPDNTGTWQIFKK